MERVKSGLLSLRLVMPGYPSGVTQLVDDWSFPWTTNLFVTPFFPNVHLERSNYKMSAMGRELTVKSLFLNHTPQHYGHAQAS